MKRGNDNAQLRPEEVDALDDVVVESGVFQRASADVIASRKIVRSRRSKDSGSDISSNPTLISLAPPVISAVATPLATENDKINPFAGFAGLSKTTAPRTTTNPFSNFAGFSTKPAAPTPVIPPPSTPSVFNKSNFSSSFVTNDDKDVSEYKKKLKKLNTSFLSWINRQSTDHPNSIWREGVQDYLKHSKSLSEKYGINEEITTESAPKLTSSVSSFTNSFNKSDTNKSEKPVEPKQNLFQPGQQFEFQPNATIPPVAPFQVQSTNSFNFSGLPTMKPAGTENKPTGFGGFSLPTFNSQNLASAAPQASATSTGEDDEGEPLLEPEKVLKNDQDTDIIILEVPCKLFGFSKDSNEWKDTGKGTLRITKPPDSIKQRMLIRNPIGKIIFNANFYKTMKIDRVKGGLRFSAFVAVETTVNSKIETSTELKNFMIKLKGTDVDKTAAKMEEAISSLS